MTAIKNKKMGQCKFCDRIFFGNSHKKYCSEKCLNQDYYLNKTKPKRQAKKVKA
jgi:hypothetical protein